MTSAGGSRVWPNYGPVCIAKEALEAHVRQLAYELAPEGVSVNAILAGVTQTPALEKIPGAERMVKSALERSSAGRLTLPEDVGRFIGTLVLSLLSPTWCTGSTVHIDGGENLMG
jgi:enoyl-[acyl-carrier-protein] reductase (NADH)